MEAAVQDLLKTLGPYPNLFKGVTPRIKVTEETESGQINVTFEDQMRIDRLSLLNKNLHEYEDEIKSLEEKRHSIEDELIQIELAMEDNATVMIEESLVTLTESQALEHLNNLRDACIVKLDKAQENIKASRNEMDTL